MSDTEVNSDIKVVIVISSTLGIGPAANRAAVLATGLTAHVPNMIGNNLTTNDNVELLSITQIPIPILSAKPEVSFFALIDKAKEFNCKAILYLARAQGMQSYEEYRESIALTSYKDLDVDAIAIWETRSR